MTSDREASPRQFALASGHIKYLGRPCKCGSTVRYVSSTRCVECTARRDEKRPDRGKETKPSRASRIHKNRRHQPHYQAALAASQE